MAVGVAMQVSVLIELGDAKVKVTGRGENSVSVISSILGSAGKISTDAFSNGDVALTDNEDGFAFRSAFDSTAGTRQLPSAGFASDALSGSVCGLLAERCHDGLVLHAAGVVAQKGAVLLPGISGAGKSTLATHLALAGFGYLTDEACWIADNRIGGVRRAVHLKDTRTIPVEITVPHRAGGFLAASCFPNLKDFKPQPIAAIVFPTFVADGPNVFGKMTAGESSFALVSHLANGRHLPGHGIASTAKLARAVPAYEARYSSSEYVIRELAALGLEAREPQG